MNIAHARKLAWSFNMTTGIEWEELFSEACLEGVRAENDPRFDPLRAKRDTFVYMRMRNRLKNYVKKCLNKGIHDHAACSKAPQDVGESASAAYKRSEIHAVTSGTAAEDDEGDCLDPWEAIPTVITPESSATLMDDIRALSKTAQDAFELMLETPGEFMALGNRYGRGELKKRLRQRGYSWPQIRQAYRELKQVATAR